ncbi:UvrD-helicase domain-containing protein [Halostella sp. JP-L12]|uniref:UvrD-helicase domain-containing protein n=1 Tax=Halostella TaxID=1843185 RepID=UPI000EF75DE3|nr:MULTISPECIES: UvrD-helicase domain-containing protein [Halostella]NHN48493.1 UvrD-helicase domain-containing protein [Halostella sp. JP-L12]
MSFDPGREADDAVPTPDLPRLDETQRRVVDGFCTADAGLFAMDSHPGAGKSTATGKAAARLLWERYLGGDPTPERRLLVTSFGRDDAAVLVPDVVDWLRELYHRGETPTDESATPEDVRTLERRLRRDGTVGTIDGVLRSVFGEIAGAAGFDGMPTVGNEALLARLRRDCYDDLADDPEHGPAVSALEAAYPAGRYDAGLRELLRDALETCRQRRLSVDEFRDRLRTAVAEAYRGGDPGSVEAIRDSVRRFRDRDAADRLDELSTAELDELTATDRDLHDSWVRCVDDFCELLGAYRERYDERCRDRGVISHTDCAHWVDRYFSRGGDDPARERVRERFHTAVRSVVVDEAQDVSTVQHAALSHLVTPEMRVLLVGDRKQCVYAWRNARPQLFEAAVRDGDYFGVDWDDHVAERATRNYRSRPDVVGAINAVATETLPDPARGSVGALDVEYPPLRPTLSADDGANVHVAQFRHGGTPGSEPWVTDDGGEADAVAALLAGGFADGTFETPGPDPPGVTLLFRRTKHMDDYRAALEARDISVGNARVPLFDTPSVRAAAAVLDWLVNPTDPERTRDLVTDSPLAAGLDADRFRGADWDVAAVAAELDDDGASAEDSDDAASGAARVLFGLRELASDLPRRRAEPAAVVARRVVDALALERDPLGLDSGTDRAQRTATLDAFVATVAEWEGDDRVSLDRLVSLLSPFLESPSEGPVRPLVDDDADVVLKTIHQMKGDQDEVVVLADPASSVGAHSRGSDRLVTAGDGVGLAPPTNVDAGDPPSVPGFDNGLYDPDADEGGDAGLRWTAEHWPGGGNDLVNDPVLRDAAAERRAEEWRLLFVALSRAQHHLVVPLPASRPRWSARDNWAAVLYDAFDLDRGAPGATHTATLDEDAVADAAASDGEAPDRSFSVAVNDVAFAERVDTGARDRAVPPTARIVGPEESWTPRFVRPSTFRPLVRNPAEHAVDHFMGRALHTETDAPTVDLPFDALGPDAVGRLAHDVIGAFAGTDLADAELRPGADPVDDVLDRELDYHADDAAPAERRAVREYLERTLVPQFADSGLRDRLERAEAVYREEPLEGLATVGGVEVEVHGQADFLLRFADGSWAIEDAKVALADDDAAEARYQLQLATYEWAFRRQVGRDATVTSRLSAFGVSTGAIECSLNPAAVEHCLRQFTE